MTQTVKLTRHFLALSLICDSTPRSKATRHGGVRLQTVRDWVLRFSAKEPKGLLDGKFSGALRGLNAEHRAAPARAVEDGPVFDINGMVR